MKSIYDYIDFRQISQIIGQVSENDFPKPFKIYEKIFS